MPHLNRTGPDGLGSKTGRKLGKCNKDKTELNEMGVYGKGRGKSRHPGKANGKGKRLRYNKNV